MTNPKEDPIQIGATTSNLNWSDPTGLIWRTVNNDSYQYLSQKEIRSFLYVGFEWEHDLIYIGKAWVDQGKPSAWQGLGTFRPKDKHDYRLPNFHTKDKTYTSSKTGMVLCTCEADQENSYQLAWVQTGLDDPELENLLEHAFCVNSKNSYSYVVRAYCNNHGPLDENTPSSDFPPNHGYTIGVMNSWHDQDSTGFKRIEIPWGDHTVSVSRFEILLLKKAGKPKGNQPSNALRWQLVNAARASYTNKNFNEHLRNAEIRNLTFFNGCPTNAAEGVQEFNRYSVDYIKTSEEFPYPQKSQVDKALTYLNTAFVAELDTMNDSVVLVSIRGTNNTYPEDWFIDFMADQTTFKDKNGKDHGQVHEGFYYAASSLFPRVFEHLNKLVSFQSLKVIVTGHSKGGAMACVLALMLRENLGHDFHIKVVTFGAPKFADKKLMHYYEKQLPDTTCYAFGNDIVPLLPLDRKASGAVRKALHIPADGEEPKLEVAAPVEGSVASFGKKALAILILSPLIVKEGNIRVQGFPTQCTEDQILNFKSYLNDLNTLMATPASGATAIDQIQTGLQLVAPAIENKMPPYLHLLLEGIDTKDPNVISEGTMLILSILCVASDSVREFFEKYRAPNKNNIRFFGSKGENYEDGLVRTMRRFVQHVPSFAVTTGTDATNPYVYTQNLDYLVENDNGELESYSNIDGHIFHREIVEKVQNEKFGDWLTAIFDDHSAYWKVLSPFRGMS